MKTYCQLKERQIQQPPAPKDRHFYRPEQFIWSNPYRSSSRLYRYFHASNDHYQSTEAKRIHKLQLEDKENQQQMRVAKLIKHRSKSRQFLKQRQLTREKLQKKSHGISQDTQLVSSTRRLIGYLSPSASRRNLDCCSSKTSKSIKTLKQLDSHLSQLPQVNFGQPPLLRSTAGFGSSLMKIGSKGKMVMFLPDMKRRNNLGS